MAAIGCLFPVLFLMGGAIVGAFLDGDRGAMWGGLTGLVIGLAIPVLVFYALATARKKSRRDGRQR